MVSKAIPGFLTLLLMTGPASAEPLPVTVPAAFQHDLAAGPGGTAYRVFVGLPADYDARGDKRYPVTYVLDGNVSFPVTVNIQRMYQLFRETPEMIVVGVGYPVEFFPETFAARWRDLTPWRNDVLDAAQSAQRGIELRSGGGADFLRFLREHAIPFVDENYRTTGERALYGHSLGGLFTLYALFEAPELFGRFAASSPSLDFSEESVFVLEAAYADAHDALPARLFLSFGSEEPRIAGAVVRLTDLLRAREYDGFTLRSQVFQDESHASVYPAALSTGLRFLYAESAGIGEPAK